MLRIDISAHFIVDLNLFSENRSIMGALSSLWASKNHLPFCLIFLFGIIVPLVKSLLTGWLLVTRKPAIHLLQYIGSISKWAMADVFAIGIFTAFFGANAMQNTAASLQDGFYYFASYVILSIIIVSLLEKIITKEQPLNP